MTIPYDTRLPPDLAKLKLEIEAHARSFGLDFYDTIFEVVDADDLNEIAAYGGFPTRYPHWSFGMQYEELKKGYEYGLSKIYEMVINNDPCYAYLMRCNHTVDQKLVMAHVYGHCLAPETMIVTRQRGNIPITEVKPGDKVLTHNYRYRPVAVCARRPFQGRIIVLTVVKDGEAPHRIRITPEHPIFVERNSDNVARLEWIKAGELRHDDKLVCPHDLEGDIQKRGFSSKHDVLSLKFPRSRYAPVLTIESEDYDGFVYNFSVKEDESYTLSAGFAVHNCDFFKNNAYFAHTSRKMMDEMANHGMRVRQYSDKHGEDEVERFVDRCMSIDDLIDIHSTAIKRREEVSRFDFKEQVEETEKLTRFESKDYMDEYINPRAALKAEGDELKRKQQVIDRSFPEKPERDVLLFLIEFAPLKAWQRDVLSIIRDEAYYFAPQGQTKIMNEGWACLVKDSLIFSSKGLMRLGNLVTNRDATNVHDGDMLQTVYDWAKFENRDTVRLRTRRGYEVEGSTTHRLMLPDGDWKRLDAFKVGDGVKICPAPGLWPTAEVAIAWQPQRRVTLGDVASRVGVDIETVIRYRNGVKIRKATPELAIAVAEYDLDLATLGNVQARRKDIYVPETVDERFATILGYLVGDGHISDRKRTIGLTTGDEEQADAFVDLVANVLGMKCKKRWDDGRCRLSFSSQDVRDLFVHLGMTTGVSARAKQIPDCILQSPKAVVAAFLRAYFDCDGYAGKQGVILSTASETMGKTVQVLLLNFGILSSRRRQPKGCWHVHVTGHSAGAFLREIGFGLSRKQDALRKYLADHQWFKAESWEDEVVALERGRADVYDISVAETHRYAAQGFVNHNSFWHSTIMTERALEGWECVDYADHHSGTMAMSRGRLNPYKLGIELFRDIERRWNTGQFGKEWEECENLEKKRAWNLSLGLGRKKIFEVRKIHNDVTFLDTFLTPEFCVEQKLFSFAHNEPQDNYVIESREFQKIKQRLLFSLSNHGRPFIYVVDGNYKNRGELLLRHEYNGVDLRMDRAADTLANVQAIWSRPVHLHTIAEGKPVLLSHDGTTATQKNIGEADDPRKYTPPTTK